MIKGQIISKLKLGRFVNLDFFIESKSCELAELKNLVDVSGALAKV